MTGRKCPRCTASFGEDITLLYHSADCENRGNGGSVTPDEFMANLNNTAAADQTNAAIRSMAQSVATYYQASVESGLEIEVAVELSCELLRCLLGDHKFLDAA